MNAEILCIGTELVLGDIVNTNAQYLSQALAAKGINVYYQSAVGDNPERIIEALAIAVERSELIIFTGGLGPTADDITIEIAANALSIPLVKNEEANRRIVDHFKKIEKEMTDNNLKQAYLPKGCIPFQNDMGTAPGCAIEAEEQCIIFLPGPPSEMKAMFQSKVSPYLDKYSDGVIQSEFVHVYGIGESKIDEMLKDLISNSNPTVAPYAKIGEVDLRVTAKAETQKQARQMLDKTLNELKKRLGNNIYGYGEETLQQNVVKLLKNKHLTVATAESCTAGYISKRITDISGSSEIFPMGVSTYSNESKINMLDVPKQIIDENGAVSPEVAAAMAKGVRIKSGANIGLSITGIAGPKSDDSNKPVGLAYIGISNEYGEYVIKSNKGANHDREYIRHASSSEALNFLRLMLIKYPTPPEQAMRFKAKLGSEIQLEPIQAVEEEKIQPTNEEITSTNNPIPTIGEMKPTLKKPEQTKNQFRKLNVPSVIASPETLEAPPENFDNADIVSQKVSSDELQNMKKNVENKKKKKSKHSTENIVKSDYIPIEEEETELENKVLEQMEKDFGKKPTFKQKIFFQKEDTKSERARKVTFWTALLLLFCVLCYIGFYFINPIIQNRKLSELAAIYHQNETEDYSSSKMNPKFKDLYAKNNDLIGWITVNGTKIDYPVVQSKGDYYLRRGFDKSYSRGGTIFADENSSIKYNKETKNIVLYGHHMVSDGTMFKDLDNFLDLKFYKKTPTITFDTLYKDGTWKVFSVFLTNSTDAIDQDNGKAYNYTKTSFYSDKDFEEWINESYLRSQIDTGVKVSADDEILTLQTCSDAWETNDNKARLIIMARRTRAGEAKTVDTSQAVKNENPKYPQIWYDIHSAVNPYYYTTEPVTTSKKKKSKSVTTTGTTITSTSGVASVATYNNVATASPTTVAPTTAVKSTTAKATTQKATTAKKVTVKATTAVQSNTTGNE